MFFFLKKEDGFSLIEVLAAVAMVGILIMPISSLFTSSAALIRLSRQETEAATLAQEGMEILKGRGYAALKNCLQGEEEACWQEARGDYTRETKIMPVPLSDLFPDAVGEILFLKVLVSWGNSENPRTVSLVSYLGEGCKAKTGSDTDIDEIETETKTCRATAGGISLKVFNAKKRYSFKIPEGSGRLKMIPGGSRRFQNVGTLIMKC